MLRIPVLLSLIALIVIAGCGADEATMRRIAREEAQKQQEEFLASFAPERFDFGGALAKEWSHAQGVKTGNFIFVSGQQPADMNLDDNGMSLTDLETGRYMIQRKLPSPGNTTAERYTISVNSPYSMNIDRKVLRIF